MQYRLYRDGGKLNEEGFLSEISPKQRDILKAMWKFKGPAAVSEVLEVLPVTHTYSYVSEKLLSLTQRNYVQQYAAANGQVIYASKFDETAVKTDLLKKVAHAYFNDSFKSVIEFMVRQRQINAYDLLEIIDVLERMNEDTPAQITGEAILSPIQTPQPRIDVQNLS